MLRVTVHHEDISYSYFMSLKTSTFIKQGLKEL